MTFLRLIVVGFLAMTVFYWLISVYSRSLRREKLENRWDEDPPEGAGEDEREAYIEAGMRDYEHSLRRKLILLVYVVPIVVVAVIAYVVNTQ
ncbi:hypothetical protein [Acidimangrovimonas pyrenivorans]|uniref:Cation/multidrug efflux pump n=1 Tax=Acidimangrovimonas pyrenivorans TaxID=2030798 RepID=A0ABV7ALR5_9RHOB